MAGSSTTTTDMPPKRFRVAFSFAGEKRDFVSKVAAILAGQFGESAILYDKFHEAEFARYDLGIYLPALYGAQSDLIVLVLCPEYDEKRWTGWEWVHIYGLLTKADGHRVMPCRFEHAHADGLSPAAGFIELDDKTPEQTATLILERLALNEGKPKSHYCKGSAALPEPPARVKITNNLPRPAPFFGREQELATIAKALLPQAPTWGALIDGPGGMGKTSLAIRAAQIAADQFDRVLVVSTKVRKFTPEGAVTVSNSIVPAYPAMLNEIGNLLGLTNMAKKPEDERPALIKAAVQSEKLLLILDNLENLGKTQQKLLIEFVSDLPASCKAIVTSRRRTDTEASIILLGKLDQKAALAYLEQLAASRERLAKANSEERRRLYTEADGNPLVLRWIVGQLGSGSCWTIKDALDFLIDCRAPNDPLEFIYGDLAKEFSADEEKILCALTHFSLPASPATLAEITGLTEQLTTTILHSLANLSLVVPDQEETRFSLVPMVGKFQLKNRPDAVAASSQRLEEWAYDHILMNGGKANDRFPILDAAWPAVAAALPIFCAGTNARLQEVCNALERYIEFSGRWDDGLALCKAAEKRAIDSVDLSNAARRAHSSGWIYYLREQADEVIGCAAREANYRAATQAGPAERASAIRLRGLGHRLNKQFPAAIADFNEALTLYRSIKPVSKDVAIVQNYVGEAKRLLKDFPGAEEDYTLSLETAVAAGFAEGVACYTGDLAELAIDRENWEEAERRAREALELCAGVGRQELIGVNCHRLAKALVRQRNAADALPHARRAVDIFSRLGSPKLAAAQATLAECDSGGAVG
jgi:tetratricopeptide (TPR) repeat protein